jgi:hypothetical protein
MTEKNIILKALTLIIAENIKASLLILHKKTKKAQTITIDN